MSIWCGVEGETDSELAWVCVGVYMRGWDEWSGSYILVLDGGRVWGSLGWWCMSCIWSEDVGTVSD